MARTWILDGRAIARKVKNGQHSYSQSKEWRSAAVRECPKCKHQIDNSDVSVEWPGLPAGVKFDPSDSELIDHLLGKNGIGCSSHPLIDEFIPTVEEDEGICYTHPENLPGAKKDGTSIHFFHRTSNAYSTGQRKRRKIQKEQNSPGEHVRWHKTGRTRPVIDNGVQKGCKKIMVLYRSAKKSKPDKTNWVMHQYHLGTSEDEKDGELVVSKIFYQQQQPQIEKIDIEADDDITVFRARSLSEESDFPSNTVDPRTPKTNTPDPPKQRTAHSYDDGDEDKLPIKLSSSALKKKDPSLAGASPNLPRDPPQDSSIHSEIPDDKDSVPTWLAGESQLDQIPEPVDFDTSLLCNEVLDPFHPIGVCPSLKLEDSHLGSDNIRNNEFAKDSNIFSGFPDLDNIDLGTPPDFNLSDLQFGSQESIMSWLDRL